MKRIISIVIALAIGATALTGCGSGSVTTSKSYTFKLETGDKVEITLDTSDGFNLEQEDGTFTVTKDAATVLNGIFLTADMRNEYVSAVKTDDNAGVISDTDDYFVWMYDGVAGTEYNRIAAIPETELYLLVASLIESDEMQAAADSAYEALTFGKA